jgi:nicotinic acid mononucleotide adenylyltransferase
MAEDEPLPSETGILPGSFNPLHAGHGQLAQVAAAMLGREVVFELSVRNVDKQPLQEAAIRERVAQFGTTPQSRSGNRVPLSFPARVVLTDAPLIAEKAQLFPGCVFIIGYDTAARLLDQAYYGSEESVMIAALATIRDARCRLLVAGRLVEGVYRTLADLAIPPGFENLFQAIPEALFRMDISSTEIRAGRRT